MPITARPNAAAIVEILADIWYSEASYCGHGGYDMKKIRCMLLVGLLIFALCACSQNKPSAMCIKPSAFSEETQEVLSLFDDEIQFFDISFDETAKSYTISVWLYHDGEWSEGGATSGNVDHLTGKIAVRLTETDCDLYTIDENGHVKCSFPVTDTPFDESTGIGGTRIDRETPIALNQEIPLWVRVGTTANSMRVMDITDDFRNAACNAGFAVTITVSDKEVDAK